ncbi:hypothetical protein [Leptospira noguchii]|uniref:hypothetical protein n=1 Tax=Leptospira noguchii TaxID=28182 RepID=UPI001FB77CAD|nr:hypothetical protein [Leptospira noguchii]UOG49183.1 hypothetical protein MAL00_02370 [Leptospira noguchii]
MKRFLRKRLKLNTTLTTDRVNSASHSPWVVRQVVSQSTMKFASCDDDPGNSVNAYIWVGVQGVVALSLLFAPIFLRRTHVN